MGLLPSLPYIFLLFLLFENVFCFDAQLCTSSTCIFTIRPNVFFLISYDMNTNFACDFWALLPQLLFWLISFLRNRLPKKYPQNMEKRNLCGVVFYFQIMVLFSIILQTLHACIELKRSDLYCLVSMWEKVSWFRHDKHNQYAANAETERERERENAQLTERKCLKRPLKMVNVNHFPQNICFHKL